jgi:predicted nucleic acid-binding protein
MFYIDSSVIVALLTGEPSVSRIRSWLGPNAGTHFLITGNAILI